MAKSNKKKYYVQIEISQNGQTLSSKNFPFGKERVVKLTSGKRGDLFAPYYPLMSEIDLLRITKDVVEVDLDTDWEGFTTYKGKIEEIGRDKSKKYLHLLSRDDIGTFINKDLRVSIKIKPLSKKIESKIHKVPQNISKKTLDIYFNNRQESRVMSFALICTTIIFIGIYSGLMSRSDDTPKNLIDLEDSYSLAFINADHFQTVPEAMQEYLDRDKPIKSTYEFYLNYTKMMLGNLNKIPPYLFKNTARSFIKKKKNDENEMNLYRVQQREFIAKQTVNEYDAVLSLPSVKGESYRDRLIRIKNDIGKLHDSFKIDLSSRIKVTNQYIKDTKYEHKKIDDSIISKRKGKKILTIREMEMYRQFDRLSERARYYQKDIKKRTDQNESQKQGEVYISKDDAFVSTLNNIDFSNLNKKLSFMNASTFMMRKSKKIKEPMIGRISSEKIEKVIVSKKFEIQLCYEAALRRNRKISGVMNWSWMLNTSGKISDIRLERSNITDDRMINCIRRKLSQWKFPRPRRGSVKIEFPFKFSTIKG